MDNEALLSIHNGYLKMNLLANYALIVVYNNNNLLIFPCIIFSNIKKNIFLYDSQVYHAIVYDKKK